jgi:hypothetical protein
MTSQLMTATSCTCYRRTIASEQSIDVEKRPRLCRSLQPELNRVISQNTAESVCFFDGNHVNDHIRKSKQF